MTNLQKIRHLYWRAGFGLSPEEWQAAQNWSLQEAIDRLFSTAQEIKTLSEPSLPGGQSLREIKRMSRAEQQKLRELAMQKTREQNAAWIGRMVSSTESAFLERVCLFWHGHFACELKGPRLAARQLNTLRQYALGNFRDLVQAIAKDVAMIRYLNNQQNRKQKPNENFARELLELFTIGRGNYTEEDIKEAARAFTGWSSNLSGDFVFRTRQHDYGTKTFMGRSGNFNGDEIIDIILEKKATAEFICRKMYRYFVNEKVDEGIVQDLARDFYRSGYDIKKLLRQIFSSNWFYAPHNVGNRIKSPIDLIAGMMRSLQVEFTSPRSLTFAQRALGQMLFRPPNVAGWPGGKSWIDNSTLLLRLNLAAYLYQAADIPFKVKDFEAARPGRRLRRLEATTNFQPLIELFGQQGEAAAFEGLQAYFLGSPHQLKKEKIDPFTIHSNTEDYIKSTALRLMSLPEYQLC